MANDGNGSGAISKRLPKGPEAPNFLHGVRMPSGDDLQGLRNLGYSWGPSVTAHAAGGFPLAEGLIFAVNTIGTCAADGDSIKLPQAIPGLILSIFNDTAHNAQLFAYDADEDTIDGVAGDTGISVLAGTTVLLRCGDDGDWTSAITGSGAASLTRVFETRVIAAATNIPPGVGGIVTLGYTTVGDGGGAEYVHAGGSTTGGFQDGNSQWWELAEQPLNVKMFGAYGDDGVHSDQTAFADAATLGKEISVPQSTGYYKLTSAVVMTTNSSFVGDESRPEIRLVAATSQFFTFTSIDHAALKFLTFDGTNAAAGSYCFVLTTADYCEISDCIINNMPSLSAGVVAVTTSLSFLGRGNLLNGVSDHGGSFFFLSTETAYCNILNNKSIYPDNNKYPTTPLTTGFFLVDLFGTSNNNLVEGNVKIKGGTEIVGCRYSSSRNRIIGNTIIDGGDVGISLTGQENTCIGNVIVGCLSGIVCWGGNNIVSGNLSIGPSNAGFLVQSQYGGTGQFNTITDNFVISANYGIAINWGYTAWAGGQVVAIGDYRYNGFNIYQATTAGTTTAGPGPVCTSSTCSDGTVTWRYLTTFSTLPTVMSNYVQGNTVRGSMTDAYHDFTGNDWRYNYLTENQANGSAAAPLLVVGGGVPASYTGLNQITARSYTTNAGVLVEAEAASIGRFFVGDGTAIQGGVEVDMGAANDCSLWANGAKQVSIRSTGALMVKSLGADPTAVANGEIYYNSNTGKFRGRAAGAWVDLN